MSQERLITQAAVNIEKKAAAAAADDSDGNDASAANTAASSIILSRCLRPSAAAFSFTSATRRLNTLLIMFALAILLLRCNSLLLPCTYMAHELMISAHPPRCITAAAPLSC